MCAELAATGNLTGWRQHDHLWKKVKSLSRKIDRIALKKGPNYVARMKVPYRELLREAQQITERARQLCLNLFLPTATQNDLFGPHTLQAFIARTPTVTNSSACSSLIRSCTNAAKRAIPFSSDDRILLRRRGLSQAVCSNGEGSGSSSQTAWAAGV
jgi:hypothetical protein